MDIKIHPHAQQRMIERGAAEAEVRATVQEGDRFEAKWGRTGFRKSFPFDNTWRGKQYENKEVEVYAEKEDETWLVITVITRYH